MSFSRKIIIALVLVALIASSALVDARKYFNINGNPKKESNRNIKWEQQTTERILSKVPQWNQRISSMKEKLSKVDAASEYQVTQLPGLDPSIDITHYAGLINVNETANGNLFFWFFQANVTNPSTAPLLIWINGGPGCSSMDGLFLENGPFRLTPTTPDETENFTISINPFSWHNSANVLYIDEPVGTGLSYVVDDDGLCVTDEDLEQDFYQFLQNFFAIPLFAPLANNPFYLSGESYAGHYIPHYANYILTLNDAINAGTLNATKINLQGVLIGNGWTHPIIQYDSYAKVGYNVGIIDTRQENYYNELVSTCQAQISAGILDSDACNDVLGQLISDSGSNTTSQINVYDVRLYDPTAGSNWPVPGIYYEADYLNSDAVREAIHASMVPHPWTECNDTVNALVANQDASSLYLLPLLLARIRVLLYNGNFDLICNHIGTTEYLRTMEWDGQSQWLVAPSYTWAAMKDGTVQNAGYTRSVQNLTYLLVLFSSHMAPMDQPESTYDMVYRFLNNVSYVEDPQSLGINSPVPSTTSSKGLKTGAWVGITVGGFVGGILIGVITMIVISRIRSNHNSGYSRINN